MFFTATSPRIRDESDRKARFEHHVRQTHRQAYTLAYRLTGNRAEAEDLVQEAFLRAFRFFHRYDEALPFSSWLYRILSNAHIDMVRRRGRLKLSSLDQEGPEGTSTWEFADATALPDRDVMFHALEAPIQDAVNTMTAEFRTAVLLSDIEGLAYEEIAEIMGTSVGTVRSRIHRGRKQIRRYLERHHPQSFGGAR
jgi:RNA polymerase sigma-70 factor (ECF subfamily)